MPSSPVEASYPGLSAAKSGTAVSTRNGDPGFRLRSPGLRAPKQCIERHRMLINRHQVTIEWGHCDPAGIVYFPNYFSYFDASTNALFLRALGFNKYEMLKKYGI